MDHGLQPRISGLQMDGTKKCINEVREIPWLFYMHKWKILLNPLLIVEFGAFF